MEWFRHPRFHSITELLAADDAGSLSVAEFDDSLWLIVSALIDSPSDCADVPDPVVDYYASRLIQWDVENGGFAQAAFNYLEWFDSAARGYERIGLPKCAELIRRAQILADSDARRFRALRRAFAPIDDVFRAFRDSKLAPLDARIHEVGWDATSLRVTFVRAHLDAFRALDRPPP